MSTVSQGYTTAYGYDPGWPADVDLEPEDLESAALRALAVWLLALEFQHTGDGTTFAMARVTDEFPDDEQELIGYPTANVQAAGDGVDEVYSLTPEVLPVSAMVDGYALTAVSTKRLPLQVDIWCRDRQQRRDVARVLDNERAPLEGTGSLILPLPTYWNLSCRYNWNRSRRWDDGRTTIEGDFRLTWWVEAICPVVRATVIPLMAAGFPQIHPSSQIGPNVTS